VKLSVMPVKWPYYYGNKSGTAELFGFVSYKRGKAFFVGKKALQSPVCF